MFYKEKKFTSSAKTDNYVSDYDDHKQWCKHCVYFGTARSSVYWLCAKHYPEFSYVSFCGHCDKFSKDKKINLLKQWLLKIEGFQFRNKVR